jgi:hypothetical protein
MAGKRKPALIDTMDDFAVSLIKDVRGNTIPGVEEGGELKARVDVFNAVVRYAMVRNKVYPDPEEKESGLDGLIRELQHGSAHGNSGKAGSA